MIHAFLFQTTLLFCILLSLSITFPAVNAKCTRQAPSFTDCSTTTGECDKLYDSNSLPVSLPFPPPNTRTCHRTCFENDVCRSTPTVVHEQKLAIDQLGSDFRVQRIFSPRFGKGGYRKSTNCRYSMKCDPGQLLTYSVHSFDLEPEGRCFGQNECLDWVQVGIRNLGNSKRFCGTGEVNEVHVDGADEMTLEFVSNRLTEKEGFLYFITCISPGFDQNGINEGIVASSQSHLHKGFRFDTCSQPADGFKRPTIVKPTSGVFGEINPVRTFVVKMSGSIFYKGNVIEVRDGLRVVNAIRGITRLEIANRFSSTAKRHYVSEIGLTFRGYGTLEISRSKANFYYLGADPIFQPSPEETKTILELEKVINTLLGDDDFDVFDRYDLIEDINDPTIVLPTEFTDFPTKLPTDFPTKLPTDFPTKLPTDFPTKLPTEFKGLPITISPPLDRPFERSIQERAFGPINIPEKATQLASQYSNACNAVLRATACTYQALIMGKDCKTGLSLS